MKLVRKSWTALVNEVQHLVYVCPCGTHSVGNRYIQFGNLLIYWFGLSITRLPKIKMTKDRNKNNLLQKIDTLYFDGAEIIMTQCNDCICITLQQYFITFYPDEMLEAKTF